MGYKIGFDLDGVLATQNSVDLHYIDRLQNQEERELIEERYYRNCDVRLNPRDFMHETDKGYIITARLINNWKVKKITERWVSKNFPDFELIMVGNNRPSGFKTKEEWDAWNDEATNRKVKEIVEHGIQIYFDDSPSIVERLRTAGVVAIQYGGRL